MAAVEARIKRSGRKAGLVYDPKKKRYSRRGLALVAWAYDPKRFRRNEVKKTDLWGYAGLLLVGAWLIWRF